MKKALIILMAVAMLFAMTSLALATDITPNTYSLGAKDWGEKIQGTNTYFNPITGATVTLPTYGGLGNSTHPYGTWNSPYTYGVDGYNYNDSQDYTDTGKQVGTGTPVLYPVPGAFQAALAPMAPMYNVPGQSRADVVSGNLVAVETTLTANFTSGPHGGYLTSTHKCRECHAVHRAAGKFKLMRANTRFEACDWCHGTGAGSGFNIQMDSDDAYTTEYNTGHTMGFGIQSGKWKAPDDTYPAFTPNYWLGGFSCFDCHSPHANPQRIMGYDQNGKPIESIVRLQTGEVFNMGNPGHDMYLTGSPAQAYPTEPLQGGSGYTQNNDQESAANYKEHADGYDWVPNLGGPLPGVPKPYYLAGSWLLLKDPDRELATSAVASTTADISYFKRGNGWGDDTTIRNSVVAAYGSANPLSSVMVTRDPSINNIMNGAPRPNPDPGVLYGSTNYDAYGMPIPYADPTAGGANVNIAAGEEIPDTIDVPLNQFSASTAYPINKVPTDWNNDLGSASIWASTNMFGMVAPSNYYGYNVRNPLCRSLIVDEFCTDCHDGNAGLHTIAAPLFSEDRALRDQTQTGGSDGTLEATSNPSATNATQWKGEYDIAYGHDVASRH